MGRRMNAIRKFFARFRRNNRVGPSPESKLYSNPDNPEQPDSLELGKEMKAACSRNQRKIKEKTVGGSTGNKGQGDHRIPDTIPAAIESGTEVPTEGTWQATENDSSLGVQCLIPEPDDESPRSSEVNKDLHVDLVLELKPEGSSIEDETRSFTVDHILEEIEAKESPTDENDNQTGPPESPTLDSDLGVEKECWSAQDNLENTVTLSSFIATEKDSSLGPQSLTPDAESPSSSEGTKAPPVDLVLELKPEGSSVDENDNETGLSRFPILNSDADAEKKCEADLDNKVEGPPERPVSVAKEEGPPDAPKYPDPEVRSVRSWAKSETLSHLFPEMTWELLTALTDIWVKNTILWNEGTSSAFSSADLEKELHDVIMSDEIRHLLPPKRKYSVKMKLKDATFMNGTSDPDLHDYMDLLWSPSETEVIDAITLKNQDSVPAKVEKYKSWRFDRKTESWKKVPDESTTGKTSFFGSTMKGLRWIGRKIKPKKREVVPSRPVIRQRVRIIPVPSDMTISTPLSDLFVGPDGQRINRHKVF